MTFHLEHSLFAFNVKDSPFNAKGDAITVRDGVVNNGSPALSSGSHLFTAQDVGKHITVFGAGTGGANLDTTIIAFVNIGQVTMGANSQANINPATVIWGTDDGYAIQAAIDAAVTAKYGVVVIPPSPGAYLCNEGLSIPSAITLMGAGFPSGGINTTQNLHPTLLHNFTGDFIHISGANGSSVAQGGGVAHLRLVQMAGQNGGADQGSAIKIDCVDPNHRPGNISLSYLVIEESGVGPWTWAISWDGTNDSITPGLANNWMHHIGTHTSNSSTGAVSIVRSQVKIEQCTHAIQGHYSITGSFGFPSGNVSLTDVDIGGNLNLDFVSNFVMSGGGFANLTTTSNATGISFLKPGVVSGNLAGVTASQRLGVLWHDSTVAGRIGGGTRSFRPYLLSNNQFLQSFDAAGTGGYNLIGVDAGNIFRINPNNDFFTGFGNNPGSSGASNGDVVFTNANRLRWTNSGATTTDFLGINASTNALELGLGATKVNVGTYAQFSGFTGFSQFGIMLLGDGTLSTTNFTLLSSSVTTPETWVNAPSGGHVSLTMGGADSSGLSVFSGSIQLFQNALQFGKLLAAPSISQITPTTDSATRDLLIQPQAPFASATVNLSPGNLNLNIPAHLSGGTDGYINLQSNGTTWLQFTPSGLDAGTASILFKPNSFKPLIAQPAPTTDQVTKSMTISAQDAYSSATLHPNGGNLTLNTGIAASGGNDGTLTLKTGSTNQLVIAPSSLTASQLAGTGTRLVTASSTGVLGSTTNTLNNISSSVFGDGSDGYAAFNTSSSLGFATFSAGVWTLNRDICLTDATVDPGITLKTNGYRIYGTGTLTIDATGVISNNGSDGNFGGITNAGPGAPAGSLGGGFDGGAGGSNAVGGDGNSNVGFGFGPSGTGAGGNGGAGGGNAGGNGGSYSSPAASFGTARQLFYLSTGFLGSPTQGLIALKGGSGGAGGGSVPFVGQGGGGGGGSGVIVLCFNSIVNNGSITANGGNGGNAGGSGGASGGGGSGGGGTNICITRTTITGSGVITANSGTAGLGINGGANGSVGANGQVIQVFA